MSKLLSYSLNKKTNLSSEAWNNRQVHLCEYPCYETKKKINHKITIFSIPTINNRKKVLIINTFKSSEIKKVMKKKSKKIQGTQS